MYITIAGELGSGKSTVAKIIHDKYGYIIYSTGTVQREIAKEKGITTLELNLLMANDIHNDYDKMIDNKTIEIANTNRQNDVIFDSRMAWHFVDQSFKVYVIVDNYVAANRVILADRGREEHYDSIDEAVTGLVKRKQVEDSRFSEMYQVNTLDFHNYDLVVDSTGIGPEELAEFIIQKAKESTKDQKVFLSPSRLFPTHPVKDMNPSYIKELQDKKSDPTFLDVVLWNGYYFIIDGHHRACARIQNNEKLIGVNILKVNAGNIVEKCQKPVQDLIVINQELYSDWESFNSIQFVTNPAR